MTTISVIHVFLTAYLTGSAYTNCLTPSHGRSILMTLIVTLPLIPMGYTYAPPRATSALIL